MARLIVGGTDHGPHAFIVQLRSLADHKPMPGVTVGDIGPKFGYGGVDNGYMSMDYVRVPRSHMLMRFAQVRLPQSYRCYLLHFRRAGCFSLLGEDSQMPYITMALDRIAHSLTVPKPCHVPRQKF